MVAVEDRIALEGSSQVHSRVECLCPRGKERNLYVDPRDVMSGICHITKFGGEFCILVLKHLLLGCYTERQATNAIIQ